MNIKRLYLTLVTATAIPLAAVAQTQAQIPTVEAFNFDEVTYTPAKTTFKLFAPKEAKRVVVEYDQNADTAAVSRIRRVSMKWQKDGYWMAVVKKNLNHREYRFCVNGQYTPGVFAKAVGVNGAYGMVLDLRETDPEGWSDDVRPAVESPADLVIYEMHHRDFSIWRNVGSPAGPGERTGKRVACEHPGKFLALTEPWAINHLKELGVNAIHILPSYDFGSIDETRLDDNKYNWGYDPVNYNVPEGSYSTDPYDPLCRIREFKQMVQALHKVGIRVILDVVYNHTFDIEHSNFQRTYPDYYYRLNSQTPKLPNSLAYSNGSGCGNETASDRPMMRRFMIESVKHWIREYHIDGLRFDLMGVHDIETMNEIRAEVDKIDPTIFIYGEGWSAGQCAYPDELLATKANTRQLNGIAAFSDDMRDALRGPFSDDTKGAFLAGIPGEEESLKFGIVGAIAHPQVDMSRVNYSKEPWANEPTQQISYVSCHDDMCLTDRLRASVINKHTALNTWHTILNAPGDPLVTPELIRLDLLAQTAVFTSQGVPFMLSGEEMLRDKKGVHNSFESPDSVNHLDWNNLKRYPQVFEYYKNLIALRKHHPAFRLGKAELVRQHLEFLNLRSQGAEEAKRQDNTSSDLTSQAPCLVAFRLKDVKGIRDEAWQNIIVILNANREPQTVSIPEGRYTVVCCDGQIDEQGLGEVNGDRVVVDAQSALIIHD